MRSILIILMFLVSNSVFANISSNFTLTSDYVWRGITQTNHEAAVQGGLDFEHASGFALGTWLSNVAGSGSTEADFYASYGYSFSDDFSASIGGTFYHYTQDGSLDTFEANLGLELYMFSLSANHVSDEYFGADTASTYISLSTEISLIDEQGLGLALSVGSTSFDEEAVAGSNNFIDYRIAVNKTSGEYTVGVAFTDTDRETTAGVEQDDNTFSIAVSRSFSN